MTPGRETTEYALTMRAEIFGAILASGGGFYAIQLSSYPAAIVSLAGVILMSSALFAYGSARGSVKSAALRPRVQNAPPGV